MIGGEKEYDEGFGCINDDDDEHEQWASDVIVFNNVKRIGICKDGVDFNEWRRSESCNNRSLES
jgi:hypothetical protein